MQHEAVLADPVAVLIVVDALQKLQIAPLATFPTAAAALQKFQVAPLATFPTAANDVQLLQHDHLATFPIRRCEQSMH